jgi:mannose-6-phosphate isomerase-like protein (cupin superfamily)
MERRDFLHQTALLAAFGLVAPVAAAKTPDSIREAALRPVLLPGQAPLAHKGGMDIRVWMRSAMTNGLFSSVECAVAPKKMGPPPHHHLALDELMFVLEGTASVLVGEEVVHVQAGGWHLRPRLIKHTFWNAADEPLRFVDMYFNQPFEEFLERIFHELTPEKGFADGSDAKRREIDLLNTKYGLVYASTAWEERQAIAAKYQLT